MSSGNPTSPEQARIADLQAENDNLRVRLTKANRRIKELEYGSSNTSWEVDNMRQRIEDLTYTGWK
jgi:predicted  nucleic acid-binding Zn-ribbon protein